MGSAVLRNQIESVLQASEEPCSLDLLFLAFPDVPQGVVRLAIAQLCEIGRVEAVGGRLRLTGAIHDEAPLENSVTGIDEPFTQEIAKTVEQVDSEAKSKVVENNHYESWPMAISRVMMTYDETGDIRVALDGGGLEHGADDVEAYYSKRIDYCDEVARKADEISNRGARISPTIYGAFIHLVGSDERNQANGFLSRFEEAKDREVRKLRIALTSRWKEEPRNPESWFLGLLLQGYECYKSGGVLDLLENPLDCLKPYMRHEGGSGLNWEEFGSSEVEVSEGPDNQEKGGPVLDEDELIGFPSSTEKPVEHLSEEEISSILSDFKQAYMYQGLEHLSDEPLIGAETAAAPNVEDSLETGVRGVFYRDSVKRLSLSSRPLGVLEKAQIKRVDALVSHFETVSKLSNCGTKSVSEILSALDAEALCISDELSDAQKRALVGISKSDRYVYNACGILCKAPVAAVENEDVQYSPSDGVGAVSLGSIGIPSAYVKRFASHGIRTVADAKRVGRERLLALRGVGIAKIEALFDAIDQLEGKGASSSNAVDEAQRKSDEPESFLGHYSRDVLSVIERVCDLCEQASYPVHRGSFAVVYADYARETLLRCDNDSALAVTSLFDDIEDSETLKCACTIRIARQLDKLRDKAGLGSGKTELRIPSGVVWRRAIGDVLAASEDIYFDEENETISLILPTICEWVETLSPNAKEVLKLRFSGKTLAECGQALDVSRERVRQLQEKALVSRPALAEDEDLHFVSKYSMDSKQFSEVTGKSPDAYNYLAIVAKTKKSQRVPLVDALDDDEVPERYKSEIRRISDVGYGCLEGKRVHMDKRSIIEAIVETYASEESISVSRLIDEYNSFLEANDAEGLEAFAFTDERAIKSFVERDDCIMLASTPRDGSSEKRPLRYYDWNAYDFQPLEDILSSGRWSDIECSAMMLYRDEAMSEIVETLDLRNEYELHCAIKRVCTQVPGLRVLKRPNLVFGNGNRKEQILELIKEIGPIDAFGLSREYELRYGVNEATFRGSYLKDFEVYCRNGVYSYVDEGLDDEKLSFLRDELTGNYLSITVLKMRFKTRFPDVSASLVNERNLNELGYHVSSGLAIRNGVDESALFGQLIESHKIFSAETPGFGVDVFNNESFLSQLRMRERAFSIVESEKGVYIKTDELSRLDRPVAEKDFRDYIDSALEFMVDGTPYTIRSLVLDGFTHALDTLREDMGFSDYFYASVLSQAYVGGRVKLTTVNGTKIFCECSGSFSAPVFFESVIKDQEAIEIDELTSLLADRYGIEVGNAYVRNTVKRSSLYYNASVDMVFTSVEAYARKVEEWI